MDFRTVGGGGSKAVKLFTDTFVRSDTPSGLGSNWLGLANPLAAASIGHDSNYRILSNKAHLVEGGTAGGSATGVVYVPWQIIPATFGKTQFAQFVCSALVNGAGIQPGVAVACSVDPYAQTAVCYTVVFDQSAVQYRLFLRLTPDIFTNVVILSPDMPCVLGDTIRLSVQFSALQNTLIVTRNGVIEVNTTDNSANRPISSGFPGLYGWVGNGAGTADISSFSCGVGL